MFKRLVVLVLLALLLLLLVLVLRPPMGLLGGKVAEAPPERGRPECPRHEVLWADSSGTWVPSTAPIAGSGAITFVPEYHDCQRLRLDKNPGWKFGPLIAVFARIHAESVADPPGFVPPNPPQGYPSSTVVPMGISGLSALTTTVVPSSEAETGRQRSVATILNYDQEYQPLHIQHGYSCLYVYHDGSDWKASIVKAESDADCLRPLSAFPSAISLNVQATYDPKPAPVARWDWDADAKEHYLGIICGTSWCEVWSDLRPILGSSPQARPLGKGWYDEQYLAVKGTPTDIPDPLTPGEAQGTVAPIGDLTGYEADDGRVFEGAWIPVANVSLSIQSQPYEKKLKYNSLPSPEAQTFVYLCKGRPGDCNISWLNQLLTNKCDNATDPWWAKIESPAGTKYRCVVRRKPTDQTAPLPPGIVRWRWKIKDEGMWIRCPGGCCEKT